MTLRGGVGQMAGKLEQALIRGHGGQGRDRLLPGLGSDPGPVHLPAVQTGRGAGLETFHVEPLGSQPVGEVLGGGLASPSGGVVLPAHEHLTRQEGPRGQNHSRGLAAVPPFKDHPPHSMSLHPEAPHVPLQDL